MGELLNVLGVFLVILPEFLDLHPDKNRSVCQGATLPTAPGCLGVGGSFFFLEESPFQKNTTEQ